VKAAAFVRDTAEGRPAQKVQVEGSFETKERERQVGFLSHAIRKTYEELGGKVTIEEIWSVAEEREREIFQENVQDLRPAVFAALGQTRGRVVRCSYWSHG
jgi:hypothetical protein